jgi:hypothetical protein
MGRKARMKTLAVCLFVSLCAFSQAEVYAPKARPVISELVLSDGRTLKDAKILSDTAYTVNVATGGKIIPVEKKLLPAELLTQWPVDEARAEKDRAAEQALIAKRDAAIVAKQKESAAIAGALKKERAEKAAAYDANTKAEHEAREEAFKNGRSLLAASRGGLIVEGAGSSFGKIYVLVKNVSASTVTFDWASLRVAPVNYQDEHQLAGVMFDSNETEDLVLKPMERRVFRMRQTAQIEIKSIRWIDREERCPVKQLYRQRNSFDMRDQYAVQRLAEDKAAKANVEEDEVTKILLAATKPYVGVELRK